MTTFKIEIENKGTGKITFHTMNVICNDVNEYMSNYKKSMKKQYLSAKTMNIVSRMYVAK